VKRVGRLFEEEPTVGSQHASDLTKRSWPVVGQVQRAEADHRVIGSAGDRDR
jgi:hypothetical protein